MQVKYYSKVDNKYVEDAGGMIIGIEYEKNNLTNFIVCREHLVFSYETGCVRTIYEDYLLLNGEQILKKVYDKHLHAHIYRVGEPTSELFGSECAETDEFAQAENKFFFDNIILNKHNKNLTIGQFIMQNLVETINSSAI